MTGILRGWTQIILDYVHPRKLIWIPKMMVWKRKFHSKMAIFSIYVRFLECIFSYLLIWEPLLQWRSTARSCSEDMSVNNRESRTISRYHILNIYIYTVGHKTWNKALLDGFPNQTLPLGGELVCWNTMKLWYSSRYADMLIIYNSPDYTYVYIYNQYR